MKAERRHELKENELVVAFAVARDYLDKHGTRLGVMLILLLAVVAAIAFSVRSRAAAVEDIWRRRDQLSFDDPEVGRQSIEALASMTLGVSDERFVFGSLIEQGLQALRLAQEVPAPPDPELNERAREAFEQLLERFGDNPLGVGLARSGLATVEENAFVLDFDSVHKERVEEHLTAILNDPALNGMPFQRMALDRRNALDETFTTVSFEYPMPLEEPDEGITVDHAAGVEAAEDAERSDPVGVAEPVSTRSADDEGAEALHPDNARSAGSDSSGSGANDTP